MTSGAGCYVRGEPKSTRMVPRDVNPVWASVVVLESISSDDIVQFVIKDIAVFKEAHFGGGVGPKVLASGTAPVGTWKGYLEIVPSMEIQGSSSPLLEVELKVVTVVGAPVHSAFASQAALQAFQHAPSAPKQEDVEGVAGDAGVGGVTGDAGDAGDGGRGEADPVPGAEEVPVMQGGSTVSPWHIDDDTFTFAKSGMIYHQLELMQEKQRNVPFASAPFRNYNVLGAGFDKKMMGWPKEHLWEGMPETCVPADTKAVLRNLTSVNSPSVNESLKSFGVTVIMKWLEHLQVTRRQQTKTADDSKLG